MPTTTRTPFAMVPLWVLRNPVMTPTLLMLYTCLAAESYDRKTRKSVPDLMDSTGLKKTAIYAGIKILTDFGAITVRDGGVLFLPMDPPDDDSAQTETLPGEDRSDSAQANRASAGTESHLLLPRDPSRETPPPPTGAETPRPCQQAAHQLATLAFQQIPKPVIAAGRNGNAFCAVRDLIEARLVAGESPDALIAVIESGVKVWTTAGLATAVAMCAPKPNGRNGHNEPAGYDAIREVARRRNLIPNDNGGTNGRNGSAVVAESRELRVAP
jgi:hypothetical protein